MANDVFGYVYAVWIFLFIFWMIGAGVVKSTERRESASSRASYTVFIIASYLLLFTRKLSVGFLGWRFVRESSFIEYAGFAITVAGALLAVWARVYIGRNWSSNVTIKQNHELIQGGPYALVRHPIYSGLLLATLGTAITIGEVRGLIALPLSFAGWQMKSMVEERFMREQFGRQYVDYERRVRALIPFVY